MWGLEGWSVGSVEIESTEIEKVLRCFQKK